MIKVLLVDDNQEKIREVVKHLIDSGIDRKYITVARDAQETKNFMMTTKFDLLILDMALPERVEDAPNVNVGMDLLNEISERDEYYTAKYIICMTALEEDDLIGIREDFKNRFWQIIVYKISSIEWKAKISDALLYARRDKEMQIEEKYLTDVLIITALEDPELNAVKKLNIVWSDVKYLDEFIPYYEGVMEYGNEIINLIACNCPNAGMISAAITSSTMLRRFRPRIAIMTGICAGFSGKSKLGDVVISDPAWNFEAGKILGSSMESMHKLEIRQVRVDYSLLGRIRALNSRINTDNFLENGLRLKRPTEPSDFLIGPTVSGSAVISSSERMDEIKLQDRNLATLDMEVAAFYQACSTSISPAPLFFAVKSVTDLGDSEKSDDIQEYGSMISARFAEAFIKENISFIRVSR